VGLEQDDFQTVLKVAAETETMQENIQDWFQLDEEVPGFQLLTEKKIAAVIFFIYFHWHYLFLERQDGMVWIGLLWLRIGTSGGPL
jgi:hypothetical protein